MQLSIVVPSYNSADTLEKCLSSLSDERFDGRLEVIVVDDGSKDSTYSLAMSYAERQPGIFKVVTKPNGGHGSAVNMGLDMARGEYFRIIDSDDWVNPDGLLTLLNAIEISSPDMFVDERVIFHVDEHASEYIRLPKFAVENVLLPFEDITGMEYSRCLSMHTISARTSLLREHGVRLLEHTYYVDMQFVIGVASFARTVYLIKNNVYFYSLGAQEQSCSHLNYVKNYAQHDRVLKTCVDFCNRSRDAMPEGRYNYARYMLTLLTRTQYNIALIYNPDRREGMAQARELNDYLTRFQPWLARSTRGRWLSATILHKVGVGYGQLQRLKAAAGHA